MRRLAAIVAIIIGSMAIASPALAGKSGGGKTSGTSYTGSFSLVLVSSSDGLGHYGKDYTFKVTTSAPYPFVKDECYQGGTLVYQQTNGYYAGWMWGQTYNWSSSAWTGGAADCTATLYYTDSQFNNPRTMSTLTFHVYA